MKISNLDANAIRGADAKIKEKQEQAQYYMEKAVKDGGLGKTEYDMKYEKAKNECNEAKYKLDKLCNKYNK